MTADVKVTVVLGPDEYRLAHEILTAARQQQEDYINGTGEFDGEGLKRRTEREDPTLNTEKENLSRELEKLVRLNILLERL